MEEEAQPARKRNQLHNLQPKVESLEFLDDVPQPTKQPAKQEQSITYVNMDSFSEKTATVANQQQTSATRKHNWSEPQAD